MIESRQNPTVKRLRDLREAKDRQQQGRFLIDGMREIERALEKNVEFAALYFCRDFPIDQKLFETIQSHKIELIELGKQAFEMVSYRENPTGLLVEAKTWPTELSSLEIKSPTLVVIAEDIEKPGNLGTLLRTCDAVGVDAVIGCNQTVDLFNPNALRASAGGVFSVPYATGSLEEVLAWLKEKKLPLIATSPAAKENLWTIDLKNPLAIAVGSEAWGLSREMLAAAQKTVSLPMKGLGDSLNVSVATGVFLYEVLRQRSHS